MLSTNTNATLTCLLASAGTLTDAYDGPFLGETTLQPWSVPKAEIDAAFTRPNATGVYPNWAGTSLSGGFTVGAWNITIAVKDGIALTNSLVQVPPINKSHVFTGTRVYLAASGAQVGVPVDQSSFLDKNNSTSISLCLVLGWGDGAAPSAGNSAEDGTAKCFGVDQCKEDLGRALRLGSIGANCYDTPPIPRSCVEQLGWRMVYSTGDNVVAMNHSQLLSGGLMLQWGSDPHDPRNFTDYRAAVRSTFGAYAYFVMHEKDNSGNRTRLIGSQFNGFMCARAKTIAPGSQNGASVLGTWSYAGLLAMVTSFMMAM